MKTAILRQIDANKQLNLFSRFLTEELHIDEVFHTHMQQSERLDPESLERLIDFTTGLTLGTLYSINQYIQIPTEQVRELKAIYSNSWQRMKSTSIHNAILEHHIKISYWLKQFYPDHFVAALSQHRQIGRAENREYSAAFQLAQLNKTTNTLQEPILDIGCGLEAVLVRFLRSHNKSALGIDRLLTRPASYLKECSWFEYDFESAKWGTLIAHMSLSNHIRYCLANEPEQLPHYFELLDRILFSLKPGGEFIYTPSIPGFELE